jgi:hypothetical protein
MRFTKLEYLILNHLSARTQSTLHAPGFSFFFTPPRGSAYQTSRPFVFAGSIRAVSG